MGTTVLTLLTPAWELSEKLSSLETTKSFVAPILDLARNSGNETQIEEFSAKLESIDKEINELI